MNFFKSASANPNASVETLEEKRIAWNSGLKGYYKPSDETIAKTVAKTKGQKRSAEFCANLSAKLKGKPKSDEHRVKIGALHKGKTISTEARAKSSAKNKGRKMSAEFCANLSAKLKGRTFSDEWRAKLVDNNASSKPLMTPSGLFPSKVAAARSLNITVDKLNSLIRKYPKDYYIA